MSANNPANNPATTPASTTRTGRHALHWPLAVLVTAASVSLAPTVAHADTGTTAAARSAGQSAQAAPAALDPGLSVDVAGRQVSLSHTLTGLPGLSTLLGLRLDRHLVTFTSASDPTRVWTFETPQTTLGDLTSVLRFDSQDPTARLRAVSVPSGGPALPDGSYVVRTVTTTLPTLLTGALSLESDPVPMVLRSVGAPGAPSGLSMLLQGQVPVVGWTPPSDTGGVPVTGYVVTAFDGPTKVGTWPAGADALSVVLTGLTQRVTQVVVVAVSSVGQGAPGEKATDFGPASAPTGVVAVPGDAAAAVSWTPGAEHGVPTTGYTVTATPGGQTCTTTSATTCSVGGLGNGTSYTFVVRPSSAVFPGTASDPSAPVTPATVPGQATWRSDASTVGFDAATLRWAAPTSDGGSPVTGYRLTVDGRELTTSELSTTITGLRPETAYDLTLRAVNARGAGPVATLRMTTGTAPVLSATVGSKAKRSGSRAALVRVDLNRASTVVVRIVRGRTVATRTVALSDAATWVSVPVTSTQRKLLDGKRVALEVRSTTGTLLAKVTGMVKR